MVLNDKKTYGQLMVEAREMTDRQEVGETMEALMRDLKGVIEDIVNKQYETCMSKGFELPKYYIHIMVAKEPFANNTLRIRRPHCRVTRPSPYQDEDHYLWSVSEYSNVKFEWCIPKKEVVKYILDNPNDFDTQYVAMLRKYVSDKIETLSDYLVDGKVQ